LKRDKLLGFQKNLPSQVIASPVALAKKGKDYSSSNRASSPKEMKKFTSMLQRNW
jgi:hypothetical protein